MMSFLLKSKFQRADDLMVLCYLAGTPLYLFFGLAVLAFTAHLTGDIDGGPMSMGNSWDLFFLGIATIPFLIGCFMHHAVNKHIWVFNTLLGLAMLVVTMYHFSQHPGFYPDGHGIADGPKYAECDCSPADKSDFITAYLTCIPVMLLALFGYLKRNKPRALALSKNH